LTGFVNVTVVGLAAQLEQTVTMVVQPSGMSGVYELGDAVAVYVVLIFVKPVGQISMYSAKERLVNP
jgi:hypothetical protein